jgi:hypothetical protein
VYVDDMPLSEALAWEAELDRQLAAAPAACTPESSQLMNDLDDVRRRIAELDEGIAC